MLENVDGKMEKQLGGGWNSRGQIKKKGKKGGAEGGSLFVFVFGDRIVMVEDIPE